jgi:hypothetical protein
MRVIPMPLVRIPEAFDDPDWIYELKLDGFGRSPRLMGIAVN